MTKEEFSKQYGYSLSTLKTSFGRTQKAMRDKGYIVTKTGSWPNPDYQVIIDKKLIPPKKEVELSTRLVGRRFGHLTVIKDTGKRLHRSIIWECKCDCGNEHEVTSNNLNGGSVNSCGKMNCPYHKTFENLKGQRFGKLIAMYPTSMKDGSHMYWVCQCDCGNQHEVSSSHLKDGTVQSCGCISTSIGEINIENILKINHIEYKKQVTFKELKNIKPLRYDFGIYQKEKLIRLIEFDGIQHFKEQNFFTHDLESIQKNDKIKNQYCRENNIPLVRIPYWERDQITLEMLLGDEYLIE